MRVFLTEAELELARRMADWRTYLGQIKDYRVTRREPGWNVDFIGARGEVACCKHFNYPVDIHVGEKNNRNPDLYIGNYGVEVKATKYHPPILKLDQAIDFVCDFVIMCRVYDDPRKIGNVDLAGIVGRQKFLDNHYAHDFGHGIRACYNSEDMTSIQEFDKWIAQRNAQRVSSGSHVLSIGEIHVPEMA